jgi:hypothetical protein
MNALKFWVFVSFLCVPPLKMTGKTVLPDSCGNDSVNFDVKTEKGRPEPAAPGAGKALLVVSESFAQNQGFCLGCKVTTRVGLDGKWIGANNGNSYFAVEIDPGEHHLCVGWQSVMGKLKSQVGLASFTAQAGSTYYYESAVKITSYGNNSGDERELHLAPLSADDGQYRVKAWRLATWKSKE